MQSIIANVTPLAFSRHVKYSWLNSLLFSAATLVPNKQAMPSSTIFILGFCDRRRLAVFSFGFEGILLHNY
jgi:hypothetical protein